MRLSPNATRCLLAAWCAVLGTVSFLFTAWVTGGFR